MVAHTMRSLTVLGFLALASSAHAQPIAKWTLRVYSVGAASPLSSPTDLPANNVSCNVDPATLSSAVAVPLAVAWNDPAKAGKLCVWVDPGTGPLASTPVGGSYEVTITATNGAGTTPESPRVSFRHPDAAQLAAQAGILAK